MTHKNLAVLNASETDAVGGGYTNFANALSNVTNTLNSGGLEAEASLVTKTVDTIVTIAPIVNTPISLTGKTT
ncbi:hypothetical protein [Glaciimonas immobilis]|uniref:Uncharacterized protein n=1 Tax=Glaciimonas immobilis TaxID=728004 RepID=A0A840RZK5_9BURK|nr:hypothetical protein [Glaciimonas immobilis]KAF3997234.1 hypothetical protein HAV38_16415 [Glaciimonas immobilis]MBB5202286.1 hypothetical protein [Glaciimonas immobilis]